MLGRRSKGRGSFGGAGFRGRLDLALQLQQIATQAIRDFQAQVRELQKLGLQVTQAQKQDDNSDRGSGDAQRKHYEHELHYWHSPVCKRLVASIVERGEAAVLQFIRAANLKVTSVPSC